jgi:hypothetical protein
MESAIGTTTRCRSINAALQSVDKRDATERRQSDEPPRAPAEAATACAQLRWELRELLYDMKLPDGDADALFRFLLGRNVTQVRCANSLLRDAHAARIWPSIAANFRV